MSNDFIVENGHMAVKLDSRTGDALLAALLEKVRQSCRKNMKTTFDRVIDRGMAFTADFDDMHNDAEVILACDTLLTYVGLLNGE